MFVFVSLSAGDARRLKVALVLAISCHYLMMHLIFSAMSTFVFDNKPKILHRSRQIFFCRCRHLKVHQIRLVQSPINLLGNQKFHLSHLHCCFFLVKTPLLLYLFISKALPDCLRQFLYRRPIGCQSFALFQFLTF